MFGASAEIAGTVSHSSWRLMNELTLRAASLQPVAANAVVQSRVAM
jgi:hypothetical protein